MKKYLAVFTLFFVLGIATSASAQVSCEEAMRGTCAHFLIGDGQDDFNSTGDLDQGWCLVDNPGGAICIFDVMGCNPAEVGDPDGHDIPGTVVCDDCGSEAGPFSINEAKCCLYYGQSTNPTTGKSLC